MTKTKKEIEQALELAAERLMNLADELGVDSISIFAHDDSRVISYTAAAWKKMEDTEPLVNITKFADGLKVVS